MTSVDFLTTKPILAFTLGAYCLIIGISWQNWQISPPSDKKLPVYTEEILFYGIKRTTPEDENAGIAAQTAESEALDILMSP